MVKNFIVYSADTGLIIKTGSCPEHIMALQANEGELVMEGVANDYNQKVENGVLVDRDTTEEDNQIARDRVRMKRDHLLMDSDKTQLIDYPITDEARLAWRLYREELRGLDYSQVTKENESQFAWPTAPS